MDLQTLLHKENMDREDLVTLLGLTDPTDRKALRRQSRHRIPSPRADRNHPRRAILVVSSFQSLTQIQSMQIHDNGDYSKIMT